MSPSTPLLLTLSLSLLLLLLQPSLLISHPTNDGNDGSFCGIPDSYFVYYNQNTTSSNSTNNKYHPNYSFFKDKPRFQSFYDLKYGYLRLEHFDKNTLGPILARAFKRWEGVTPLTFREKLYYEHPDVLISFERGEHGDRFPFDGPGGVLAHAFPQDMGDDKGKLCFDADESNFSVKDEPGINEIDLESVAVHEIGHILGLGHSTDPGSVMYKSLRKGVKRRELAIDDIIGIKMLYH